MEGDGFGFDFTILDVDFVATKDDGDIFADTNEITWMLVERQEKWLVRCQLGTFLYVMRDVTSNIIIPH